MSTEQTDDAAFDYDQHSTDAVAYDSHFQCPDYLYGTLLNAVKEHLVDERGQQEHLDLDKVQLKKVVWEDGVLSYQATHPHAVHEDHMEGEIDPAELEDDA